MTRFNKDFQNKNIHILGVTGAEGSAVLRFLRKKGDIKLTVHDFSSHDAIEKSFKLWHKGIEGKERDELFHQFQKDLKGVVFNSGRDYLKDIENADIIFVPQSWRLYKEQNQKLWQIKKLDIPFYSLTRLYLNYSRAKIIGVTGTVGKGSVSYILRDILEQLEENVYFAGNDTWMVQPIDHVDDMTENDYLILEISHRQLLDGIDKSPHMIIYTNIFPNHLDEVTFSEYVKSKIDLSKFQTKDDFCIINFDSRLLINSLKNVRSEKIYYSHLNKKMNIKGVQQIYNEIMSMKSDHYPINLLAASTAAILLGAKPDEIISFLPNISGLPARLSLIGNINGKKIYNDLKSTTPWATLAAVDKLNTDCVIMGGKGKGINYTEVLKYIKSKTGKLIILRSELSEIAGRILGKEDFDIVDDLRDALKHALNFTQKGGIILITPGAAYFYTDFIKGKKSIKKIISLLQEEPKPVELAR